MASLPISKFGENLPVTGVVAFSQVTVGVGVGLLIANKMGRSARRTTAIALIGAGVAAIVPLIAGILIRLRNRPGSRSDMRRKLDSIREGDGLPESEEIF